MADKKSDKKAKPGDVVKLAQPDGGFYDRETKFKIVNDQEKELGDEIGKRTNRALLSGGLLVVKSSSKKSTTSKKSK